MDRIVLPEILDELPPADPRAIGSRRDLRRINGVMGNAGVLAAALRAAGTGPTAPARCAELGAGDGALALALARRLAPAWPGVAVTLVDRRPAVTAGTLAGFTQLGWTATVVAADVFAWLDQAAAETDVIVANLFLHHFPEADLRRLLARAAARTRLFAACEPRRSPFALAASGLVGLLGANAVTRHDAVVSVRAGFTGAELSARWPAAGWTLREGGARAFSHVFTAARAPRPGAGG